MNDLEPEHRIDPAHLERQVVERDRQVDNPFTKDAQVTAIRVARRYRGDRLTKRAYPPHRILDPKHGPLVAVRLRVLSRKTLGGLHTDLSGRVLDAAGAPVPGLYAAGEVSGFGGGGVHGYRALEGTFVGGCLFSGRQAGRAARRRALSPWMRWRARAAPACHPGRHRRRRRPPPSTSAPCGGGAPDIAGYVGTDLFSPRDLGPPLAPLIAGDTAGHATAARPVNGLRPPRQRPLPDGHRAERMPGAGRPPRPRPARRRCVGGR